MCVCVSVCLSPCLSACLSVCLPVCLSVRPSVCLSVCLSVRVLVRYGNPEMQYKYASTVGSRGYKWDNQPTVTCIQVSGFRDRQNTRMTSTTPKNHHLISFDLLMASSAWTRLRHSFTDPLEQLLFMTIIRKRWHLPMSTSLPLPASRATPRP